ncbi:hypothetical protein ACWF58_24690, partial [Peribacillus butanolivorans]
LTGKLLIFSKYFIYFSNSLSVNVPLSIPLELASKIAKSKAVIVPFISFITPYLDGVLSFTSDVVMESTGVYWKPIWNIPEGSFHLVLANARHVKNVPGRKTDVKDAESCQASKMRTY